jgi:lipoprotein-anchoring transpeptidase ErfK/SrfK
MLFVVVALVLLPLATVPAQQPEQPAPTPPPAIEFPKRPPIQAEKADKNESERSDVLTGGHVEVAEFAENEPNIRLTLNIPTFRLTLWQNDKEVKSYYIGVGRKEHPLFVGERDATEIIWNPAWIPPPSDWVLEMSGVSPGEVIPATDPRNPLGKLKIPLGDRYLIHQAAKLSDVGNLVSHGCVRVPLSQLYDLVDKIIAARGLPVSRKRIDAAKRSKKTYVVRLKDPLPVDINYDTLVVEEGKLHIYPDVYARGTNRVPALRAELQSVGVESGNLTDATLRRMLRKVGRRTQFVVDTTSIADGRALEDGKVLPLIPRVKKT